MSETAIVVEDLNKVYKLYDKPSDRLKEALGFSKTKKYTEYYALNHVSLNVEKGQTVGIIGTNGSGKSTILKIITGVLSPTSGNVNINGRISALLELGAGFNMEYTGIENVYLNGTMIGFSKEEIDAKLNDILEFADIGDFVNQPVKTYSSGMFVRLAFAVAINIEPEILIVDEALSVGDVFFQAKCYKKFEQFKKMGKTILFVSHDLSSISKYCDKVILLDRGTKIAEGNPKEIVDKYKKLLVNQLDESDSFESEKTSVEELKNNSASSETDAWKYQLPQNPNIIEYGDQSAEIIDYGVWDETQKLTNVIEKGSTCKIRMKVKCNHKIEEPIFAFTIKNLQGTEITGTNTFFEDVETGVFEAGEEKTIEFSQSMDLQGGEYLISFGCTGYVAGNFQVFHRLYDVLNLTVVSYKNTVGFYDMNSEVKVIE